MRAGTHASERHLQHCYTGCKGLPSCMRPHPPAAGSSSITSPLPWSSCPCRSKQAAAAGEKTAQTGSLTRAYGGRPSSSSAGLLPASPALQLHHEAGRVPVSQRTVPSALRELCTCCPAAAAACALPPPPLQRRQDPTRCAPVVGCFSSSLSGSVMSSSRPRRLVLVLKAAPQRCNSVGSMGCSDRASMVGRCAAAGRELAAKRERAGRGGRGWRAECV